MSILNEPVSSVVVVAIFVESALLPIVISESVNGRLRASVTFQVIEIFS